MNLTAQIEQVKRRLAETSYYRRRSSYSTRSNTEREDAAREAWLSRRLAFLKKQYREQHGEPYEAQ